MSARLRNLNPYELHKYLVNVYCLTREGSTKLLKRDSSKDRTDIDVIRENHKFLWEEDDVADSWEKQLAKKYYDKLFKEYCICDLTRYKENKVALRWRIEREVVLGKGQFQCGNKHCLNDHELKSWEVNFAYVEENQKKNALIKVRLCPECSDKLNYRSKKREVKRLKKKKKNKHKEKQVEDNESEDECPRTPEGEPPDAPSTSQTSEVETASAESLWKKGLCPECSDKLNYRSKKREVKRLKKKKKNKHKEKQVEDNESEDECPRTPEGEPPDAPSTSQTSEVETASAESLWKKVPQETEEKTREEEFEEYLDDLLL